MSQYFAKLLVVGGDDIEDGDYYLFEGKITKCKKSIIPELKQFYGEEWDSNWFQKVKLFICTINIQVGDKFRHYHIDPKKSAELKKPVHDFNNLAKEEDTCDKVEDGKVWWSRDSIYVQHRVNYATGIEGTFKVIGEVSPDATWVREGDQFTEEDIKDILKTA